jgi:hypothetical protein
MDSTCQSESGSLAECEHDMHVTTHMVPIASDKDFIVHPQFEWRR